MRYLFVVAIFNALMVDASAQTGKGVYMIGGSMNFQRDAVIYTDPNTTDTPTASVTISPNVGYFFVNRLMTGVEFSYKHSWTPKDKSYRYDVFGAGPVARYYFPIGKNRKLAIFPEVALQFQASNLKARSFDTQTGELFYYWMKLRMNTYRAVAGVVWFPVKNIGIEGTAGYALTNYAANHASLDKNKALYVRLGLQFYLHNYWPTPVD